MTGVHVTRSLDMGAIDAVGFDLDHTLALYDDAAVNGLAYEETCGFLTEAGGGGVLLPAAPYDETQVCRGLLLDTASATVVKLDASGRVRRARRRTTWLSTRDIEAAYAVPIEPSTRFHPIHSPFDLPTAFFFGQLAAADTRGYARACATIRRELDRVHTRGRFKHRLSERIDALVRPLASGSALFEALRAKGKRLFVLTNSDASYTEAVLHRLFGPAWRDLFECVVAGAGKPGFFTSTAGPDLEQHLEGIATGAGARWLEQTLGVAPQHVLYVGDNVPSDAIPARERGWRTALVVAELAGEERRAWGSALYEDTRPTWLAAMIAAHADVYAAGLEDLFTLADNARLTPSPHPLAASRE